MYEVAMSSTGEEEQIIQDGFPESGSAFLNKHQSEKTVRPRYPLQVASHGKSKFTFSYVVLSMALVSLVSYHTLLPSTKMANYPVLTDAELSARWEGTAITSKEDNNFIVPMKREFASQPTIDHLITASIKKSTKLDKREIIQSVDSDEVGGQTYIIESGDTLSAIAQRTGVKLQALIKINGISDPRQIKPGMKLLLSSS